MGDCFLIEATKAIQVPIQSPTDSHSTQRSKIKAYRGVDWKVAWGKTMSHHGFHINR